MELAEKQADAVQVGVVEYLKSDEFEIKLAEKKWTRQLTFLGPQIKKEEKMFRALADLIQNLMVGLIGSIKITR